MRGNECIRTGETQVLRIAETPEERLEAALSALRSALRTHQEALAQPPYQEEAAAAMRAHVVDATCEAVEAARARLAAVVAAMAAESQEATQQ